LVIENLRPETDYVFYVRAKNVVGVGERAEIKATTIPISQLTSLPFRLSQSVDTCSVWGG